MYREFFHRKSPQMQEEMLLRFRDAAASEETLEAFWEDFSSTAYTKNSKILRERQKKAEMKERQRLCRERVEKERESMERKSMEREDKTARSRSPPRATGSTIT
jgi:hypothetical protein